MSLPSLLLAVIALLVLGCVADGVGYPAASAALFIGCGVVCFAMAATALWQIWKGEL